MPESYVFKGRLIYPLYTGVSAKTSLSFSYVLVLARMVGRIPPSISLSVL